MNVPLLDLKQQFATVRDEIIDVIVPILDSQACINGPAVAELESAIAAFCNCTAAVGVSSGTDALIVSLMALDVGVGDEVICPTFTFFGTAGSILPVTGVSSYHGMGRISRGFSRKALVTTGTPTEIRPKTSPSMVPMENSVHRQDLSPASPSARAIAPCAPIGANGNGSFSTSEHRRNSP